MTDSSTTDTADPGRETMSEREQLAQTIGNNWDVLCPSKSELDKAALRLADDLIAAGYRRLASRQAPEGVVITLHDAAFIVEAMRNNIYLADGEVGNDDLHEAWNRMSTALAEGQKP